MILMYFAMAIDNLAGPAPKPLDWVELALTVILFNAAMMYARWKQALGSQIHARNKANNKANNKQVCAKAHTAGYIMTEQK